jgi:hypothetical protein
MDLDGPTTNVQMSPPHNRRAPPIVDNYLGIHGIINELSDTYIDTIINRFMNNINDTPLSNPPTSPQISSHEPQISSHEPQISSHEPQISSHEPPISSHEPPISSHEPPIASIPTSHENVIVSRPRSTNLQHNNTIGIQRSRGRPVRRRTYTSNIPPPPPILTRGQPIIIDDSELDSPVRIRPSLDIILSATELVHMNELDLSSNYQRHCPIDLNPFTQNENIIRIKHCKHIFKEVNLREHFLYSPKCPICRYDIRGNNDDIQV